MLGEGDVEERVQRLPGVVVALVKLLDRVRCDAVPVGNSIKLVVVLTSYSPIWHLG